MWESMDFSSFTFFSIRIVDNADCWMAWTTMKVKWRYISPIGNSGDLTTPRVMFIRLRCFFFPLSFSGIHFFFWNFEGHGVLSRCSGRERRCLLAKWRGFGGKKMVGGLPLKPGVIAVNFWVNRFESENFGGIFPISHSNRYWFTNNVHLTCN